MKALLLMALLILTPVALPAQSPAPKSPKYVKPESNYPYGIPIKGMPGFVTSPYDHPNSARVYDVRGFPRGREVLDPYADKIFLSP